MTNAGAFIDEPPPAAAETAIRELLVERPPSAWGMAVEWSSTRAPTPVFIQQFAIPREDDDRRIHLFGARYDLRDALIEGKALGEGHFVEFFVIHEEVGGWRLHRLLQRRSVTFTESDEEDDFVSQVDVRDQRALSLGRAPRWETDEAIWPTVDGTAMRFVGQSHLAETVVTRRLLTWGVTVYLFWLRRKNECFKVVTQKAGEQSAQAHYELEAGMNDSEV